MAGGLIIPPMRIIGGFQIFRATPPSGQSDTLIWTAANRTIQIAAEAQRKDIAFRSKHWHSGDTA